MKLLHHEAIELFGRPELFIHQVLVIRYANFTGCETVEACGEHVTQEFDGVIHALGQLHNVEQDGMQTGCRSRQAPAP